MTIPSDDYHDIFDGAPSGDLQPILHRLEELRQAVAGQTLPEATNGSILAVIAEAPRGAPVSLPQPRKQSPSSPPVAVGRSTLTAKPHIVISWPRWAWLAAAVLIVAGSAGLYNLSENGASPVSAAAVLRQAASFSLTKGQVSLFTYRIEMLPIEFSCKFGFFPHVQRGPRFVRFLVRGGSHENDPSIVIQSATQICGGERLPTCPMVVVGHQTYVFNYLCGQRGSTPGPGVQMLPRNEPLPVIADNLFYGASAARTLEDGVRHGVSISARQGFLQGHHVYVVTARDWLGERGPIILYFDAKTYVLRGMDIEHAALYGLQSGREVPEREQIRLVRERINLPPIRWLEALKSLPRYTPEQFPRPPVDNFGADLIVFPGLPAIADLRRSCPGVRDVRALLAVGKTPLEACHTAFPPITATTLAWRLMRPNIHVLNNAVHARIFSRRQVRASIGYEHTKVREWVNN